MRIVLGALRAGVAAAALVAASSAWPAEWAPAKPVRMWFEVTDTRGHIEDGKVAYWQVTVKVGFTLEE